MRDEGIGPLHSRGRFSFPSCPVLHDHGLVSMTLYLYLCVWVHPCFVYGFGLVVNGIFSPEAAGAPASDAGGDGKAARKRRRKHGSRSAGAGVAVGGVSDGVAGRSGDVSDSD